ncbi:hypothetical protein VP1G_10857 [Cytospora mali]|uniref:Uncharacterized protein n=1 Tax=Cytospora mali TaxID=578113 RepID=A0A194UZ81_CYTMA|nr:hypothetical protein VP1G_10857 [Valsa mali var. pyri (nom. inval.)]
MQEDFGLSDRMLASVHCSGRIAQADKPASDSFVHASEDGEDGAATLPAKLPDVELMKIFFVGTQGEERRGSGVG